MKPIAQSFAIKGSNGIKSILRLDANDAILHVN